MIRLTRGVCGQRLHWSAGRIMDELQISVLHDCGGTWRRWQVKWPTDFEAVLFGDEADQSEE